MKNTARGPRSEVGQKKYYIPLMRIDNEDAAIRLFGIARFGFVEKCPACHHELKRERNHKVYICADHSIPKRFHLTREIPILKGTRLPLLKWLRLYLLFKYRRYDYEGVMKELQLSRRTVARLKKAVFSVQGQALFQEIEGYFELLGRHRRLWSGYQYELFYDKIASVAYAKSGGGEIINRKMFAKEKRKEEEEAMRNEQRSIDRRHST
jgi:hypothetical protein